VLETPITGGDSEVMEPWSDGVVDGRVIGRNIRVSPLSTIRDHILLRVLEVNGRSWLVLLIVGCLMIGGCGYSLMRAAPPDESTVEVPVFENYTIETGIESVITDRILEELRRMPGWKVVTPGQGRYLLKGTVLDFSSEVISVSRRRIADRNRAEITVDVSFQDRATGKDLWRDPALRNFDDYRVGPDILQNERNKLGAIAKVARKFAVRIRNRIQNTW
jgi:hypothetical protein